MKNFISLLAVLVIAVVFVSGCVQQAPTSPPNPPVVAPETPAAPPAPPIVPPVNNTPAPPAPPAPSGVVTHSVTDCTIITADDVKSVCGTTVTAEPGIKSKTSTLCAVNFVSGKSSLALTADEDTTAGVLTSTINMCRTSWGVPVGDHGCKPKSALLSGMVVQDDKYVIGIASFSRETPARWICTEDQTTDILELIESRLP